jgi:hypothetical protein
MVVALTRYPPNRRISGGGRGVAGGAGALASKGASGRDRKLSDEQLARLKSRLEQGPAAAGGGEDQRWTLARVVALIATMFHLRVADHHGVAGDAPARLHASNADPPGNGAG